uniref:Transposase n=1 Tax=mine drainage metagenome TaxID=410659 RepID=E6QVS9_9ZZZZ
MITLHTRIRNLTPEQDAALSAYAEHFNRVAHHLAADMAREKRTGSSFKNDYLRRFNLTARQFNAVRQHVEGLANNRLENLKNQEDLLSDKIIALEKLLPRMARQIEKAEAERKPSEVIQRLKNRLHQKKRKLKNLLERQSQAIQELHRPFGAGICFGGRKLFHAQHHLQENGYKNHAEWLTDWKLARSRQFFVLGSNDENAGCQGCVARIQRDGTFLLDVRLPGTEEKRVTIGPIQFPYEAEKLRNVVALHAQLSKQNLPKITKQPKAGKPYSRFVYPEELSALSWRFYWDNNGWRVMVSFQEPAIDVQTRIQTGAIGVDLNADHLAWAELDRFGNPVKTGNISCVTYGKTTEQANAIIEAVAIALTERARQSGKPLVLEKLDFSQRKAQITEVDGQRYARMLSSLSYKKIHDAIFARAAKDGVEVKTVNPKFTSVLGRINYASRYGLTVHQGAAVVIGRRAFDRFAKNQHTGKNFKEFGLRETPIGRTGRDGVKTITAPDGRGAQVTFPYPEWNTRKHVWTLLGKVSRKMKAALAAQRVAERSDPPDRKAKSARMEPEIPVAVAV